MVIVIPCYNEEERLDVGAFHKFLKAHAQCQILFINDASTDNTSRVLEQLLYQFSSQIHIISNDKNKGKAESVRAAVNHGLEKQLGESFAYLDADLATSLEECYSYLQYLTPATKFVFASRILKIGSTVERKFSRFFLGRIIATFISNILNIKVYDTQCGCKLFTKEIAKVAFEQPFISKWLFDVEIFSRIIKKYGKKEALLLMNEIPVKEWIDRDGSKVKLIYFFRLWIDLYRIRNFHKR